MIKTCVICHREFPANRKSITCSDACSKLLRKINNRKNIKKWRRDNPGMADLHRFKSSIYQFKKYHEFNDRDDPEDEYTPAGWHTCKECQLYFSYSQHNNMLPERIPYCPACGLILLPDDYLFDRYQRKVAIGVPTIQSIRDENGNIDRKKEYKKICKMLKSITLV